MAESAGNALISVFDKTGIEKFAKDLSSLGWIIYASGGTAEVIKTAGIEVIDTSKLTGGGEILGHKVVTLSREIYAGILADDSPEQAGELKKLNIPRIDLVCVDMYPLASEIEKKDSTEESVIEKTDVGGPTLLHAAAKGRRIVLSRASQRQEVIDWLKAGKPNQKEFLKALSATAEYEVADYMITSAKYLGTGKTTGLVAERVAETTYGENPWQQNAGLFINSHMNANDKLGIGKFDLIQGIPLSYNNYTDIDRLLQTVTHIAAAFEKNYKIVPNIALGIKHGNVCGAAYGEDKKQVIRDMLDGDQRAIFGGSIMTNFPITKELAEEMLHYKIDKGKRILDIIVVPGVDKDAIEILQRKNGKLRLFINRSLENIGMESVDRTHRIRHIRGGRLRQDNYTYIVDCNSDDIEVHGSKPSEEVKKDMLFAWAVGSTSNSNTICIVRNGQLLSNGVGQQDRVTAAELALMRAKNAGHKLNDSCAYSDSFFPFPDGPKLLVDAGIKAIFTTRGSVNDQLVVDQVVQAGVTFCTLPDKLARGFFGH